MLHQHTQSAEVKEVQCTSITDTHISTANNNIGMILKSHYAEIVFASKPVWSTKRFLGIWYTHLTGKAYKNLYIV